MIASTFPPKPAMRTTHSPWTRIDVPIIVPITIDGSGPRIGTGARSMTIVPATLARSVMLFTVRNVCANGSFPLSRCRNVRVSTNSTSLPRSTGRTTRGSFMPGTVRTTTLTRPSTTSCESTSDSRVPSFSICGARRETDVGSGQSHDEKRRWHVS